MNSSTFEIGSPIVHPIHGAGILKEVAKKTIRGKLMSYYVIDFPYSDLGQVMVPVDIDSENAPDGLPFEIDGLSNGNLSKIEIAY